MILEMEDLALSEWPQAVELGGSNPWLPAYGFQPPTTLLDKDDFLGNPDADLFLNGSVGQYYVYLETIQEETSDDLRSESDRSESRASPVGWLATDSETGSVIRIDHVDDVDCESEREIACVAKRRRLDTNFLGVSDDESSYSLSRSSSLLQFESLEKQCQDLSSSSPSVFSTFSYDSLEQRKINVSPDSLEREGEPESDYYKALKVDVPIKRHFFTQSQRQSSVESSDSQETLETSRDNSSKSINTLKTWRSFESLQSTGKKKASVENLSEDSGYSDHLYNYAKNRSNSNPNVSPGNGKSGEGRRGCARRLGFEAYDGDVYQNFTTNFGVSYQDLTIFERYAPVEFKTPLIERFMKKGAAKKASARRNVPSRADALSLDESQPSSKYKSEFCSEPNLLRAVDGRPTSAISCDRIALLSEEVCVSSVPKDLNLSFPPEGHSIAAQNWDIADLGDAMIMSQKVRRARNEAADRITIRLRKEDSSSMSDEPTGFRREGSYLEAMANRVDLSDDDRNLNYKENIAKSTIRDFDKQILKAISETSIQSFGSSRDQLDLLFGAPIIITKRNVLSTPNLAVCSQDFDEVRKRYSAIDVPRKSSLVNRSTSTSVMSTAETEKTLTSTKSFSGSANSKGVHFSPVVAQLNWRENASVERESSNSPEPPSSDDDEAGFRSYRRYKKAAEAKRRSEAKRAEEAATKREKIRKDERSMPPKDHEMHSSVPTISRQRDDEWKNTIIKIEVRGDHSPTAFGYTPVHSSVLRPTPRKIMSASQPALMATESSESVRMEDKSVSGDGFAPLGSGGCAVSEPEIDRKASEAPTLAASPSGPKLAQADNSSKQSVGAMEGQAKPARSSGKIGGFFSRLASFRFSTRKPDSKKNKKNATNDKTSSIPAQRVATKDDYIYIPLKGPDEKQPVEKEQHADEEVVSSKPPLPKMPPRVVGACAKRRVEAPTQSVSPGRNIDCGDERPRPMEPMGLIETDLDTEVTVITSGAHVKTRSLMNLGAEAPVRCLQTTDRPTRPHKSMEFLLDKQNLKVVEPPENELQKGERVMSEHELRIQRSLQKLTVPDWYKQAQVPREGFLLNKKNAGRESRWAGTNSKTTSLSSLGSSTQSPIVLSPTPQSQPFVRWSLSKLNSTASSPCASTRSSFNTRQPNGAISPSSLRSSFNYRQPYLGWRSQERLVRPRTPAERLANSILTNHTTQQPQESPEIQTSIKEVTSAIVHYVSGLKPEELSTKDISSYESQETVSQRSRSVSPRGSQKLCWLESSFVGTKPLDTPQTPVTLSENQTATPVPPSSLRLDLQTQNGESVHV